MRNRAIRYISDTILRDNSHTPKPTTHSVARSSSIQESSTFQYSNDGVTSKDVFGTTAPSHNSTVKSRSAPEQGAVIALGVICGLLMLGILLFMLLYFARSRYNANGTTSNIRILRSPPRPRRPSQPQVPSRGGGRLGGNYEALEFPGHPPGAAVGLRGIGRGGLEGGDVMGMHLNGQLSGINGQAPPEYFQQEVGQGNAFGARYADDGIHPIAQPDPLYPRRPIRENTPAHGSLRGDSGGGLGGGFDGGLRGGLRGSAQPLHGGPPLGSRRSSGLAGADGLGGGPHWG